MIVQKAYTTYSNSHNKFMTVAASSSLPNDIRASINRRGILTFLNSQEDIYRTRNFYPPKYVFYKLESQFIYQKTNFLGDKYIDDSRGNNYFIHALACRLGEVRNPVVVFYDTHVWQKEHLTDEEDKYFAFNPDLPPIDLQLENKKLTYLSALLGKTPYNAEDIITKAAIALSHILRGGREILINSTIDDYTKVPFLVLDILPDEIANNLFFMLTPGKIDEEKGFNLIETIGLNSNYLNYYKNNYTVLDFVSAELEHNWQSEISSFGEYLLFIQEALRERNTEKIAFFNFMYSIFQFSGSKMDNLNFVARLLQKKASYQEILLHLPKFGEKKLQIIEKLFERRCIDINALLLEEIKQLFNMYPPNLKFNELISLLGEYKKFSPYGWSSPLSNLIQEYGKLSYDEHFYLAKHFLNLSNYDAPILDEWIDGLQTRVYDALISNQTSSKEEEDMLKNLWSKFKGYLENNAPFAKRRKKMLILESIKKAETNKESLDLIKSVLDTLRTKESLFREDEIPQLLKLGIRRGWMQEDWERLIKMLEKTDKILIGLSIPKLLNSIYKDSKFFPRSDYMVRTLVDYLIKKNEKRTIYLIFRGGLELPLRDIIRTHLQNLVPENEVYDILQNL